MSATADVVLSVSAIGKTYAQPVLGDIELSLRRAKCWPLTGENGAGKSTLSKIIGGLERPTTGHMLYQGQPYQPGSRAAAERLGVRMVMQELNLLPTPDRGREPVSRQLARRAGWINRKRLRQLAVAAMAQVGLDAIDPTPRWASWASVISRWSRLPRNPIGDCHVLIFDEPTAMLTAREVELLFTQIERLQRGVAIVYISHRLEELKRIAQRIAVLRDGKLVCVEPMQRYNSEQLVNLMVGRELGEHIDLGVRNIGAPILKVNGLGRSDKVKDVSFEVRSGEIFGISGRSAPGAPSCCG
nr:sugar ABC transporter ATP-binding protein [Pseudomonas sp. BIGb0427]